jgi:acetyl esterase
MPLDPDFAAMLQLLDGPAEATQVPSDPETLRNAAEYVTASGAWGTHDIATEDRTVPGPHGEIPIRIYRPSTKPTSALLWLHGGGFTSGGLDTPEAHGVATELAARAGALVISAAYRLAVDGVRYPVPVDDAHAAWLWFATHAAPHTAPIGLGGASAGSTLALSVALRCRQRGQKLPDRLLLAYPFAHFPAPALNPGTATEMSVLPPMMRFTPESIEQMVRNYIGRIGALPTEALPGSADLTGLPPTSIVLSEYDDLRPSGELLARQLTEAGVLVETYLSQGMPHGHLYGPPAHSEIDRSLAVFAKALTC